MSQVRLSAVASVLFLLTSTACTDDPLDPQGERVEFDDLVASGVQPTLDPSGRAPLSALLTLQSAVPTRVAITVLGDQPVMHEFEETTTDHEIPVIGLHPGTTNLVEVRVSDPGVAFAVDTVEIVTDPLPVFMPSIEIVEAQPDLMEPGWTLSSLSIGAGEDFATYPIMFDASGQIRWFMDLSGLGMTFLVEPLANGNLRTGSAQSVFEIDLLGNEVRRWDFPGYTFHHDVIEKPDGNLLVAVSKAGTGTINDHVIEIDRQTGAIVREWDLRESMDPNRREWSQDPENWMHMNAVWYSEADDALILSSRNQSAIAKVSGDNELIWILAAHRGWGPSGADADGPETVDFLLTAVDQQGTPLPDPVQLGDEASADFRWSWGQHAPLILPNGNLFLFDNGFNRLFTPDQSGFSRAVEYEIDEQARTVRQVWQYGEERGPEFYSSIISDVDYLPETGNRLIMPGVSFDAEPRAYVTEVTWPDGQVVFEAKILFRNELSSGVQQWGQFDLVYRSERIRPYPDR